MLESALSLVPQVGFGLGLIALAVIVIPIWRASARKRGGAWEIEALLFICGPLISIFVAFYARGTDQVGAGGGVVRALTWIAYALALIAVLRGVRNRPRSASKALLVGVSIFYFTLLLSGLGGVIPDIPEAYWATPLLVFAVISNDYLRAGWLASVVRLNVRVIVITGFALIVVAPEVAFNLQESRHLFGVDRFQGMTGHPNTLAIVASIGVVLELTHRNRWRPLFVSIMLIAVALAQSTTGTIAILIAVLVLRNRLARAVRVVAIAGLLGAAALALFNSDFNSALLSDLSPAALTTALNGRTRIWAAATEGFILNPLLGYGPTLLDDDYRASYLPGFDAAAQAHNQFIQSLGGSGILGVIALIVLVVVLAALAWKARVTDRGLALALLVLLVARGVTETPLRPVGASLGTFVLLSVAGLIAYAAMNRRAADGPTPTFAPRGNSRRSTAQAGPDVIAVDRGRQVDGRR